MKPHVTLKKLLKKLTEDHIKKKPDMFSFDEIKHGLEVLFDENEPKDLLFKVGVAMMYCRLLCETEMSFIEIKDVSIDNIVNIGYPCETKRRKKGFTNCIVIKLILQTSQV